MKTEKSYHIVIDARLYGPKHTGIGRYTQNLLKALDKFLPKHNLKITALVYPQELDVAAKDLKHISLLTTQIPHYSLAEQLLLPKVLYKLKPDLVHFTHFNKAVLYTGLSLVTIHDLIKHFFKGKDTTTKSPWLYWPKYLAYKLLVFWVVHTSKIIVPSNFWRDYIIKNYHKHHEDIVTTYEAVDPNFISPESRIKNPESYILYTGNLYPHKNIKVILEALKKLPDIQLKIISARNDAFRIRAEKLIRQYGLSAQVKLLGYVPDSAFVDLYSKALALVHPSYMEGFSLTGLEAMALNCPVISSNTSCLPEIYQDSVLYFDPDNSDELVNQINQLINQSDLRQKLIDKGRNQIQKYSWNKTAQETLDFYLKILD